MEVRPRILYVQYTNPAVYPPLERSARILADAGWDVQFLGVKSVNHESLTLEPHPQVHCQLLSSKRRGLRQKIQFLGFIFWTLWWTFRWRPQWIYLSEILSTPGGLVLSYLASAQLLYHEHDFPEGQVTSSFAKLLFASRSRLAERAKLVVIPNAARATAFAAEHHCPPEKIHVVWNCPSRQEASRVRPIPPQAKDKDFWILYHGSIVPTRVPDSLIVALSNLPSHIKLRIIGYETTGAPGYVSHLLRRAEELNCLDRISYVGPVPHQDIFAWITRSHCGIAVFADMLKSANERTMAGASNKAFEYLVGGIPFLVNHNLTDWVDLYVEPGYALACDPTDNESIARSIEQISRNYEKWSQNALDGRQRVLAHWNYETQFAPVANYLNNSVY